MLKLVQLCSVLAILPWLSRAQFAQLPQLLYEHFQQSALNAVAQPQQQQPHPQSYPFPPFVEPILAKWKRSCSVGYCGIKADVTGIHYDDNYVYITSNSIPSYNIGPWPHDSFLPKAKHETYKFPRRPMKEMHHPRRAGPGPVGLFINGVAIYSPHAEEKGSFLDLGYWNYDVNTSSPCSFDSCLGHASKSGRYHHHTNPICLYNVNNTCNHSPLLGFAFDGFPIYGPFGFSNPFDANSKVKRMQSSYTKRITMTKRKCYSDGRRLNWFYAGPPVCVEHPLGTFVEDYEYVCKLGDLDEFNGRVCVTPEFPKGTYAYFVSTDFKGNPAYPYIVGPRFFGKVKSTKPVRKIPRHAIKCFWA